MRQSDLDAARTAEAPPVPTLCASMHLSAAVLMAPAWSYTCAAHQQEYMFERETALAPYVLPLYAGEYSSGAGPEPSTVSLVLAQKWRTLAFGTGLILCSLFLT